MSLNSSLLGIYRTALLMHRAALLMRVHPLALQGVEGFLDLDLSNVASMGSTTGKYQFTTEVK
jgi:hypothetical protein